MAVLSSRAQERRSGVAAWVSDQKNKNENKPSRQSMMYQKLPQREKTQTIWTSTNVKNIMLQKAFTGIRTSFRTSY